MSTLQIAAIPLSFKVIPDGLRKGDDGLWRARVSVSITPHITEGMVDLRQLPTAIAKQTEQLRVIFGKVSGQTVASRAVTQGGEVVLTPDVERTKPILDLAQKRWEEIFDAGQPGAFTRLHASLKSSRSHPVPKTPSQEVLFGTYHTADLAKVIESLYGSALATTLLQRASGETVNETPDRAWWETLRTTWFPETDALDPVGALMRAAQDGERPGVRSDAPFGSACGRTWPPRRSGLATARRHARRVLSQSMIPLTAPARSVMQVAAP